MDAFRLSLQRKETQKAHPRFSPETQEKTSFAAADKRGFFYCPSDRIRTSGDGRSASVANQTQIGAQRKRVRFGKEEQRNERETAFVKKPPQAMCSLRRRDWIRTSGDGRSASAPVMAPRSPLSRQPLGDAIPRPLVLLCSFGEKTVGESSPTVFWSE